MEVLDLPPGFRFHPTDEEIITYYLTQKVINGSFSATAIGEADFNKCEPWDLPQKAKMGEKEWYFFCQRDRKYPTGMRTNRATESGYWKATGKDREIFQGKSCLVGMKKTLVFYKGRAPKGEKTNWVMHEFRLHGKFPYHHHHHHSKDEWVVCRVFHKNVTADQFRRFQVPAAVLPPLLDPTDHFNVRKGSFPGSVFKQPIIENFSQIPINVGQIRANNNSEFISFSPEKMMNYYEHEQQPMSSRPVITSTTVSSFIDIRRHEQHSMSMMTSSQDTGLSPEMNNTKAPATEISSLDNACFEDFDGAGDISDLDHLWEY